MGQVKRMQPSQTLVPLGHSPVLTSWGRGGGSGVGTELGVEAGGGRG